MAEETASEKQHLPSAKRLEHMRKEGQTMRSRDLTSGLIFIVSIMSLIFIAAQVKTQMLGNFVWCFTHFRQVTQAPQFSGDFVGKLARDNFLMLLPMMLTLFVAALLSPFIFGGWNFSMKSVHFSWSKLSPIKYFGNIFSKRIIYEMLKSLFKVFLIVTVLIYFVMNEETAINHLINVPVKMAIHDGFMITERFIIVLSVTLILIVGVDVIYHFFEYQSRSKMSTQELKDEQKEAEGSPESKRRIRSAQFSILRQRLSSSVPKASVIITNPTHYAVALSYEDGKDAAPRIIAKGKGHIAQQIRQIAIANAVPLYEAPPLARAIYHTSNIGSTLHPGLYMAVAIVLSYVHQLKNFQYGIGAAPKHSGDLQIPAELIYDE
jgi:flagellar biosynthetic protein FlhB